MLSNFQGELVPLLPVLTPQPAPQERGFPLDSPALHPPTAPAFALLAPAGPLGPGSRTDTHPSAKHGVGREGPRRPSQEPRPGNRIKSGRTAGAAEGPGPGAGTWGRGGPGWHGGQGEGRGLPVPSSARRWTSGVLQLHLEVAHSGEIAWSPGFLLKGPELLNFKTKRDLPCWAGARGDLSRSALGSELSAFLLSAASVSCFLTSMAPRWACPVEGAVGSTPSLSLVLGVQVTVVRGPDRSWEAGPQPQPSPDLFPRML